MLSFPASVRVFVCRRPMDMRRSFDGLAAVVCEVIDEDPQSGCLFVFVNRSRDKVKVLWWDRSGYVVLFKRLEHGRFRIDGRAGRRPESFELRLADLMLLLDGIDLRGARRRVAYDDLSFRSSA